jgi:CHRD domain/Endosomal/lysosomal potassium channel TMEM175
LSRDIGNEISKSRIETLTDGVFAIVMTLLVLEVAVPQVSHSATLVITVASLEHADLVLAQGPAKFGFNLTGSEEVPPVQTNATGMADISAYTIASDSITYSVNATNIKGVTAGHVHFGKEGENGPVVFTMFKYDPPRDEVLESGTRILSNSMPSLIEYGMNQLAENVTTITVPNS